MGGYGRMGCENISLPSMAGCEWYFSSWRSGVLAVFGNKSRNHHFHHAPRIQETGASYHQERLDIPPLLPLRSRGHLNLADNEHAVSRKPESGTSFKCMDLIQSSINSFMSNRPATSSSRNIRGPAYETDHCPNANTYDFIFSC